MPILLLTAAAEHSQEPPCDRHSGRSHVKRWKRAPVRKNDAAVPEIHRGWGTKPCERRPMHWVSAMHRTMHIRNDRRCLLQKLEQNGFFPHESALRAGLSSLDSLPAIECDGVAALWWETASKLAHFLALCVAIRILLLLRWQHGRNVILQRSGGQTVSYIWV